MNLFGRLSILAAMAALGFVAAVLVSEPGCTDNCNAPCPATSVFFGTSNNVESTIADIAVAGPSCPPQYGVYCTGVQSTTFCTHFTITGQREGACDVGILFHDRPAEIVHLQFGPASPGGCCKGYPVIGDSTFLIPNNPDAGISGVTGGDDAITILVDAATRDDGGDGGGSDAGTD